MHRPHFNHLSKAKRHLTRSNERMETHHPKGRHVEALIRAYMRELEIRSAASHASQTAAQADPRPKT